MKPKRSAGQRRDLECERVLESVVATTDMAAGSFRHNNN